MAKNEKTEKEPAAAEAAPQPEPVKDLSGEPPELLKKMGPKQIVGDLLDAEEIPASQELYTLIGVCNGVKTGESTYGPWTSFLGTFEAIRTDNGKRFQSGRVFIPEPVSSMTAAQLADAQSEDKAATVAFAFAIGRKKAKTATGYEYTTKPLVKLAANDPLAGLRAALPAPSKS